MTFQKIGAALIFACLSSFATADDWKLVWSDEFDGKGHPDPKNGVTKAASLDRKSVV